MHYHLSEVEMPFTPDLYNLFQINLNEEVFQRMDNSIESYKIKNFSIDNEYSVQILLTKTKKVLVIQPRYFLIVKVIKRNGKNEY